MIRILSDSDPVGWPHKERKPRGRLSDQARQHVESLCRLRDARALELGVESSLLGSRATLEAVVAVPEGLAELLPWQRELLSEGLSQMLQDLHSQGGKDGKQRHQA